MYTAKYHICNNWLKTSGPHHLIPPPYRSLKGRYTPSNMQGVELDGEICEQCAL